MIGRLILKELQRLEDNPLLIDSWLPARDLISMLEHPLRPLLRSLAFSYQAVAYARLGWLT